MGLLGELGQATKLIYGQNPGCLVKRCLGVPGLEDAIVDGLFAHENQLWDMNMLRDIFNERNQNLILQIPLSQLGDNL